MAVFGAVVLLVCLGASVASEHVAQTGPESRIVSGWPAQEAQFPYIFYMRSVNVHGTISACAGSIIHQSWGLSTGRCTANRVNLMIRAGMVNINRPRLYFETNSYFTAPEYIDDLQQITQPHDIALIRFNRVINFNEFIQPVRIMPSVDMNRNYAGVTMTTAGWGTTWTWGEPSDDLNWVHLTGITNFVCLLLINQSFLVRDSTICALPYNVTSQGICSGDSGVPLTIVDDDGQITQVGVGSFASQFGCHAGFPSAFVRPGHYHDWIREVTGINFDWSHSAVSENVEKPSKIEETPTDELKIIRLD